MKTITKVILGVIGVGVAAVAVKAVTTKKKYASIKTADEAEQYLHAQQEKAEKVQKVMTVLKDHKDDIEIAAKVATLVAGIIGIAVKVKQFRTSGETIKEVHDIAEYIYSIKSSESLSQDTFNKIFNKGWNEAMHNCAKEMERAVKENAIAEATGDNVGKCFTIMDKIAGETYNYVLKPVAQDLIVDTEVA